MERKTIQQALILGIGQLTGKILSLIFLFRFANDLGSSGLTLYTYAYIPFSIFADLSAFGLIPGTSKAISRLIADNEKEKAYYLLKKGTFVCLAIGMIFFLFMLFFSRQILSVSLFEGVEHASFEQIRGNLLWASISLFVIPLLHFSKGFLQGFMKMYPSCFAIILENLVRVVLYIVFIPHIKQPNDIIHTVFLISFSGYGSSLLFILFFTFRYYRKKKQKFKAITYLYKIAIPYGCTTMFFTIYQLVDSITLSILLPKEGYYTAYMFETVRLIFFPIVLAQALGGALNPRINYLYQDKKEKEAAVLSKKCTSLILYILIPLILIMKYFSDEIYHLFYSQENGALIFYHISDLILFFGLYKVLIGISLGLPRAHYMVIATLLSGVAKYLLNVALIGSLEYRGAIYATEIATGICILASYYVLRREGIRLFVANLKSCLKGILYGVFSLLIVIFVRLFFSLRHYAQYYQILLYALLFFGLYALFLCFPSSSKTKDKTLDPA